MTSTRLGCVATLTVALIGSAPAVAQRLELSISPALISFAPADPDLVAVVSSTPVTVDFRVRANNKGTWQITVIAGGDLISGDSTIDISSVSWVATPAPPFQGGTLSRTVAQVVASGSGNEVPPTAGTLTFRMPNSWTYDAGIYTQTLVFTISTP